MNKNIITFGLLSSLLWAGMSQAAIIQLHGKNKFLAYGGGQASNCAYSIASTDMFGYTSYTAASGFCVGGTAGFQLGDFNGGIAIEAEYNVASGNGTSVSGLSWALRNRTYDGFARGQYGFEGMYWHGGIGTDAVANSFWGGAGAGLKMRNKLMYEAEIRYNLMDTYDVYGQQTVSPWAIRAKVMYGINLP